MAAAVEECCKNAFQKNESKNLMMFAVMLFLLTVCFLLAGVAAISAMFEEEAESHLSRTTILLSALGSGQPNVFGAENVQDPFTEL